MQIWVWYTWHLYQSRCCLSCNGISQGWWIYCFL